MSKAHAKLSPSAADRWIHCPGSIRLAEQCPPAGSTDYADEGTAAHRLAEIKVRGLRGSLDTDGLQEVMSSEYYCGEMEEATDFYADRVQEIYGKALHGDPSADLMVEQHFSLERWIPGGFGTSDAIVIGNGVIEVIDLKYGKGVKVEAENNPQLRLYGLGAALLFRDIYDLETVRMTIIQPRLDHISTEEMPLQALFNWAETVVKPAAQMALSKDAPTTCGDWCRWCPARATCRTRAEKQLELAQYDFQAPDLLRPEEIGEILRRAEDLQKWASDVQAYAFEQALAGEHYAGWKLVEGRSTRKWADDVKVAEALQAAGFPEAALYERKLYGITAMERIVGKKKLTEVLGDLIVKPAGKPVLVPESDKRPALNNAADDFAEELPFC